MIRGNAMKKVYFELIFRENDTGLIYFATEDDPINSNTGERYYLYTDRDKLFIMPWEEFHTKFTLLEDST
jgi:hypothetical protein